VRPSNFIVVTSIFPPTDALRAFAVLPDWQMIVVGDQKTPPEWALDGVTYLSPGMQAALEFETTRLLPWNHYSRKMLGYLYAMSEGAHVIADTDDDNFPKENWTCPTFEGEFDVIAGSGFVNVFRHFTDAFVWPRGYPLRLLRAQETATVAHRQSVEIGVWQFLADADPDVDAVYRLVFDRPITFAERPPLILDRGVVCPFNSQNTVFARDAFALLYLPAFVTFRFTDILRGLVAQPILWARGLRLAFGSATVRQERNPHDYMKDFADEIPMYLEVEAAFAAAAAATSADVSIAENLRTSYERLEEGGIVEPRERVLLDAWLEDVARVTA
jgi:hypothetical protein